MSEKVLLPSTDQAGVDKAEGKGLAAGKIGLATSTVIGISSTAPMYSLAATLGFVVIAVGAQAPVAFIAAFIPMLLTAFAYKELSTDVPDSGTAFTWAAKTFGPHTGWMAGWGVVVAGVVVMSNQTEIAAKYLWLLIGDGSLANNDLLVTTTGVLMIAAMTWISLKNVEAGNATQWVLIAIQYFAVFALIFGIGWHLVHNPPALEFSWNWFNPFAVSSFDAFIQGVLLCLFIYWGWDTCLSMAEETKNPLKTPGRAAVLSSFLLVATYVVVSVFAILYAGVGDSGIGLANPEHSDDVFFALRDAALGPMGWLLVLAVAISALATCQTTILPTARGTFAMAVYRALPQSFSKVHPKYKTPSVSTIAMGVASAAFYVIMKTFSESMLEDTVEATSVAVASYYAITSFACIVYFRKNIFDSARNIVFRLIFPLLGGVMMTGVLLYSLWAMLDPEYGATSLLGVSGVFVTAIIALLMGVLAMIAWELNPKAKPYFRRESLNRDTEVKVPE